MRSLFFRGLTVSLFALCATASVGCSLLSSAPEDTDDNEDRDPPDDPPELLPCEGPDDCDADETCVDGLCRGACEGDGDCSGFYDVCDVEAGGCVQCVDAGDCAADEVCEQNLCEEVVVATCEPNAVGCVDDATAFVCNADGTERTEAPCREDQVCRDGACLLLVCTPGRDECNGNTLVECSADGTESTATSCDDAAVCTAALGCACIEGACVDRACAPLSGRCVGNSAQRCDAQGTAFGALTDCGAELCVEGLCLDDACTPGDGYCSGTDLVVCEADGVGYDVVQCPQTCDGLPGEAACTDQVCEPLAQVCEGNTLVLCDATGTDLIELPCGATQFCEGGACLNQVCTPGARTCLGDDVSVCNGNGSGSNVQACGNDQTCSAGQCVDVACVPTCGNRQCGPDPTCGVSCGTCDGVCSAQGQCEVIDGPELQVVVSWTDAGGVDFDAYLTRDATPMCDADTCYYGNCRAQHVRPNWDGVAGNSPRDPLLDVADIVNDNPEIVRVTLPATAETYRVGAHLYADGNSGGATNRTVFIDVFRDSTLVQTFQRTLAEKTMWDGVTVTWNGTNLTATDVGSTTASFACSETPPGDVCSVDADCDPGEICVDDGNFLQPNVVCRVGCRDDDDCIGTDICNGNNDCAPAGSVLPWQAPCSSDANCDVGFTCGFLSQICEESCLAGCTPGGDCCLLSGADTCTPDPFLGLFGSCDP